MDINGYSVLIKAKRASHGDTRRGGHEGPEIEMFTNHRPGGRLRVHRPPGREEKAMAPAVCTADWSRTRGRGRANLGTVERITQEAEGLTPYVDL